jgi:uncharacterized protein involved in exopolysaccharide biosynthesis
MDSPRTPASPRPVLDAPDRATLAGGGTSSPDAGLLDYAWVMLHHWRLVVGIPFVAALITGLVSLVLPQRWTAEIEFVPEASSSIKLPSGVGALAGQLGFALPNSDPIESPAFYAKVAESRPLLERTLTSRFPVPGSAMDSAALIDLIRIPEGVALRRMEKGVKKLREYTEMKIDIKTSTLRLDVETRDARLSAAVANQMVGFLNDFNRNTRNLQARERRKFVEARTGEAQRDLEQAEDSLRNFLIRNRQYEAPPLQFERNRLERQVQMRQEVYSTLRREFEVARLEEINDTPVLTVIDPAIPPATRSSPARVRMVLVASLLGIGLGLGLAFLTEYLRQSRVRQPAAYERVARAWRGPRRGRAATRADL